MATMFEEIISSVSAEVNTNYIEDFYKNKEAAMVAIRKRVRQDYPQYKSLTDAEIETLFFTFMLPDGNKLDLKEYRDTLFTGMLRNDKNWRAISDSHKYKVTIGFNDLKELDRLTNADGVKRIRESLIEEEQKL